jgi:aminomethyltransferase
MKQLQLSQVHSSFGAELVQFAGWEMPLKYSRIIEEHLAVRRAVGLFDVSHMGEISIGGADALDFLQRMTSNNVLKLEVGAAQYAMVLNERGGVKDDVFVYRIGERDYMVVVNAVNIDKIYEWFRQKTDGEVRINNITDTTVMLALQGPRAQEVLQQLTDFELSGLKRFRVANAEVAGVETLVSRSGYTGEDGFELYILEQAASKAEQSEKVWNELLRIGEDVGIKPCGLGARDSLRLEAGFVLYGHELNEETTPLEALIDFAVKFDKGEFIGREALVEQREQGIKRKRIGLKMKGRGIPRQGYLMLKDGEEIGHITSGALSPVLKTGIGMGYARSGIDLGEEIAVEIHGRSRPAKIAGWPFHKGE